VQCAPVIKEDLLPDKIARKRDGKIMPLDPRSLFPQTIKAVNQ
jgi:hypothetical protein